MNAACMCNRRAFGLGTILLLVGGCFRKSALESNSVLVQSFKATLSGAQEHSPTTSAGTGMAAATLDNYGTLRWNITYFHLSGPATAAHFHGPAAPGDEAGVVVNIGAQGLESPMKGSFDLNSGQIAALTAGQCYINIYSAAWPDGEIRGQVVRA
jgi:hypothetical protein